MTIRVVLPVPTITPLPATHVRVHKVPASAFVGMVDNGKSLAEELLTAAATALEADGLASGHLLQKKPSASRPITLEARAELLARARIVLTGVGD